MTLFEKTQCLRTSKRFHQYSSRVLPGYNRIKKARRHSESLGWHIYWFQAKVGNCILMQYRWGNLLSVQRLNLEPSHKLQQERGEQCDPAPVTLRCARPGPWMSNTALPGAQLPQGPQSQNQPWVEGQNPSLLTNGIQERLGFSLEIASEPAWAVSHCPWQYFWKWDVLFEVSNNLQNQVPLLRTRIYTPSAHSSSVLRSRSTVVIDLFLLKMAVSLS